MTYFVGAAAVVGVVSCFSLAFVVPQGLGSQLSAAPTSSYPARFLGNAGEPSFAGESFAETSFAGPALCTGLAAGLIVGLATGARALSTARKYGGAPTGEYKEQATFAGGLVGCEFGGYGRHEFDPAGLASRWPQHLPWFREAEAKHGRVCMLATLGLIVPDAIRIPLDTFESPDLNAINAHNKLIGPGLGDGPMWWLLIFCAAIESTRFKQLGLAYENLTLQNAGDINFGKGFLPKSQEGITAMQIKELKNGRLAMMGFGGAITQAVIWDSPHFPFVPN